jgi:sigma-54-interacting transcriptional regulator
MGTLYNILVPMHESRFLLSSRVNVLLEGTDRAIDRIVTVLTPHLRHPIRTCPHWAPRAMSAGTLIIRDVETLDANEQRSLLRWLDEVGAEVQVISVVSTPLFPLVVEGRFLETLYYRLNVLYITADDAVGGAG